MDKKKAIGSVKDLEAVYAGIRAAAMDLDIAFKAPGDGSPRPRVSTPPDWLQQWRNIKLVGDSITWEVEAEGKGIKFGPSDVATVLSWGNNYSEWAFTRRY